MIAALGVQFINLTVITQCIDPDINVLKFEAFDYVTKMAALNKLCVQFINLTVGLNVFIDFPTSLYAYIKQTQYIYF